MHKGNFHATPVASATIQIANLVNYKCHPRDNKSPKYGLNESGLIKIITSVSKLLSHQSKKEGKGKELIQSSTTPDLE